MKSDRVLIVSHFANVALLLLAAYLLTDKFLLSHSSPAAIVPPTAASVLAQANPPIETKPFRWSQLESSDYKTYIANLRAIGCPEQTLRDIIVAHVDSLYAPQRAQNISENARQKLWHDETHLLAVLLGAAPSNTPPPSLVDNASVSEIRVPLVFQNVDDHSVKLTERQQTLIASLRNRFMNELGGQAADPNDPQYAQRWQAAQPKIDQSLKTLLGYQVYRQYQRASAH